MAQGGVFPNLGREITFEALGKTWKLARLSMAVWADVYKWVEPRLPDLFKPLERFVDKMDPAQFRQLVAETQRQDAALRTLESPEAQALLDTLEGQIWQFYCQLRVHHPDVTPDIVLQMLEEIGRDQFEKMQSETEGKAPPQGKAPAPPA